MVVVVEYETEEAIIGEEYQGISRAALYNRIFDIMGMDGFQRLSVSVKSEGGQHGEVVASDTRH